MYIWYGQFATAETEHYSLEMKEKRVGGMGGGREVRCMYVHKHMEARGQLGCSSRIRSCPSCFFETGSFSGTWGSLTKLS